MSGFKKFKSDLSKKFKDFVWKSRSAYQSTKEKLGLNKQVPQWVTASLFLAPAMILLAVFTFYPIINSFILSFYEGYNIGTGEIDGFTLLGNFQTVMRMKDFRDSIINTSVLVFISVPISVVLGLLIAVALYSVQKFRPLFQTIFFLPYVTNTIALGLVFSFMFRGNGMINNMLGWFGMNPVNWIGINAKYWSAMTVLLVYTIWNALAFKIIVFLSGIQGIDKQYYQAAQVDATPRYKVFRRITVPLISPMIMYITVTSFIGAFKAYTSVIALFPNGAPTGATYTLKTFVFLVYDQLERQGSNGAFSIASAASLILFGIILVFTMIQMQVSKKRVHY